MSITTAKGSTARGTGQMTAKQFDKVKAKVGPQSEARLEAARLVLVEGVAGADAGKEAGIPRQRVNDVVNLFLRTRDGVPDDWEHVSVWLPPTEAAKMRADYDKAKAAIAA
ncbi:TrfB-related DNA-binding protein [Paraburkholderia sp. GAS32]|uniref:TrfB-related DNA-binding protein n=1 Tax=Paraburkholderia sp. GAS32 TaxID=3035129 RepID=UPI003D20DBD8